jgi:hypothetical protein
MDSCTANIQTRPLCICSAVVVPPPCAVPTGPTIPVQRVFNASTCPLTTGAGINSCVVDAECPEGLIPLTCSCRISQRTDDAYWMLVSQFTTGSSVNVDGDSTCSCWWTSLRGGSFIAYQASITANCVQRSTVVGP